MIVNKIDWECDIRTLLREENLGCGLAPSAAISWFFKNVEEGIILEDDCLPNIEFFNFCSDLLDKYRSNNKVLSIAGTNFQNGIKRGNASYYFSMHNRIWGWATWRRTWKHYDYYLNNITTEEFLSILYHLFKSSRERKYWLSVFDQVKSHQLNNTAWDFQFMFMLWKLGGLTITPNVNLVTNIGYDEDATHTSWGINNVNMNIPISKIYPLTHPTILERDAKADDYYFSNFIKTRTNYLRKVKSKFNKFMK